MAHGDGIGRRIKIAREAKGISASGLARMVAVTPTAVWNWETNEIAPRHDALVRVARALGLDEEYLRTGRNSTAAISSDESEPKAMTVSEIIEGTRLKIAEMTGFDLSRVKLHLEFVTE